MPLPRMDSVNVKTIIPTATEVVEIGRGGQKLVFKGKIDGSFYALKFMLLGDSAGGDEEQVISVTARAEREVDIMRDCDSPHMVKLGPIELEIGEINGQKILYFSEDLVEGPDLGKILRDGPVDIASTIELGLDIGDAINELWKLDKVHRDIKPGNIMRRLDGSFVLLDAGLAFDVKAESISVGMVVGTFLYCSPEQFDYSSRRSLDFRSDQFALGVTMYYACTGRHPFYQPGMNESRIFSGILNSTPVLPSTLNPAVPSALDDIIMKTLGKSPHLRFRKMDQFCDALQALKG